MKAPLRPTAWAVDCPCCNAEIEIEEVEEDDAAVYHGLDEWQGVLCEECGATIEVEPVAIEPRPGAPFRAGRMTI